MGDTPQGGGISTPGCNVLDVVSFPGIQVQYDITDDIIWWETACFAFTWQPHQNHIKGLNCQSFKSEGELN